ncbi:cytochrome P450 52A11 [Cladorrhinum sp. PSN259]|nr:cytochrome P450 52A11 [Cladorrhinum sp. PSN259]
MLPNSWLLPFGLDKLAKSLAAEKQRKLPVLSLEEHERYGDTYAQYAGGLFTILTRDPRNIAALLTKQFSKFGYGPIRHNCFAPLLGDGIFTLDGPAWEHSRRLLAPIFHKPNFPAFEAIEGHVQGLLSAIETHGRNQTQIDLGPLIYDFTLDTATDFFLGKSTHLLRSRSQSESSSDVTSSSPGNSFSQAFNTAVSWTATRERFKAFYWLVNPLEFRDSCWAARTSLETMIQDGLDGTHDSKHSALRDVFFKLDQSLDRTRDELINVIFAGRDSNASLLSWVFYSLAREPEVYARLRNEVRSKLGDREPTKKEISEMEYLDCVVHETLRLFPAVPINGRLCVGSDTTLPAGGGEDGEQPVYVPEGTLICFSTYGTHRSSKLYGDDAGKFRPERWIEKGKGVKERGLDYSYYPFSAGPRRCLGENYALVLTKYAVCRLVQRFEDIRPVKDEGKNWQSRIKYQIGLTMAPDDGVVVKLVG